MCVLCVSDTHVTFCLGNIPTVMRRASFPIRRTNSAPELSNIPPSEIEGPPPELLERRRGSFQDYNDVFLNYVPYVASAIGPAAVAIHLAFSRL